MKKFAAFIILLISALSVQGQVIKMTDEIPLRTNANYDILGGFKDRSLLFLDKITSFEVLGFDQNMKQVLNEKIELEGKNQTIVGTLAHNDDTFSILYAFRKKGHPILKIHHYNTAAELVDSMSIKDYGLKIYNPKLQVLRSEDKSKILIYEINNERKLNALVFDLKSSTILWERNFTDINLNFGKDLQQVLISNQGVLNVVLSRNNFNSKESKHHFEVFNCHNAQDSIRNYKIPIPNRTTFDAYFHYDNKNKSLVAGGLYSEKNKSKAQGYYYINVPDNNKAQYTLTFSAFEDNFVNEFLDKEMGSKNKGIHNTKVKEAVLRSDGGILLIGEQTVEQNRQGTTNRSIYEQYGSSARDYFFNNIFVISIHPDGSKHWENILHKKQYSYDDNGEYSSYFLLKTPSRLRFLFNDEISNDNTISEYVIKGNGNYERNSIMNTTDVDVQLLLQDAMQISARTLIVSSKFRNRLKLIRMEFK